MGFAIANIPKVTQGYVSNSAIARENTVKTGRTSNTKAAI